MTNTDTKQKHLFYKEFNNTAPSLIFGLIIISLGIFIIPWFYKKCKEFQYLDENSPLPQRSATILAIIPITWFTIAKIMKNILFNNFIGILIEITGWIIIILLIIKFLYDFSMSFEKITQTKGIYWFFLLSIGTLGVLFTALQIYKLSLLLVIITIVIPAMQAELNSHFNRITIKKNSNIFYN